MARPEFDTCVRILRMDWIPVVSRPEIGSSRRIILGLAASSTAILIFLAILNVLSRWHNEENQQVCWSRAVNQVDFHPALHGFGGPWS